MDLEIRSDNRDAIIQAVKTAVATALEAVGLQAEGYAKQYCPVDTGNLRNSISHDSDEEYAYIGTNVEYAPYVEMGTSKTKEQPFLRPAVENHQQEYIDIFKAYLQDA